MRFLFLYTLCTATVATTVEVHCLPLLLLLLLRFLLLVPFLPRLFQLQMLAQLVVVISDVLLTLLLLQLLLRSLRILGFLSIRVRNSLVPPLLRDRDLFCPSTTRPPPPLLNPLPTLHRHLSREFHLLRSMAILLLRRSPPVLRPTLLPLTLLGKIRGVRSLPALEEGNLQCPLIREEENLRALLWFFLIFRASTASRGLAVETAMRPIEVQELSGSFF